MMDKKRLCRLFLLTMISSLLFSVSTASAGDSDYKERRARGIATLNSLMGVKDASQMAAKLEAENGALGSFALDFVMGDIWSRPGLSKRDRNLIVLTMLATLHQTNQLKYYVPGGLNHGLTVVEIREIMTHVAAYAGFPRAQIGRAHV